MEVKEKNDVLEFVGIKVPDDLLSSAFSILEQQENYERIIESYRQNNLRRDQDTFINFIKGEHEKMMEKEENSETMKVKNEIIMIRAISPNNIKSVVEKAFFNSFNLEKNIENNLQKQPEEYERKDERKKSFQSGKEKPFQEEEDKCICGKLIPGSQWVQCCNQDKCRGSSWYHIECVGLSQKDMESILERDFFCDFCKKDNKEEDSELNQSKKKVKLNDCV